MRLVYKFKCCEHNEELTHLCKISKNLYNQALYVVKNSLQEGKFLFYNDLDKIMKVTPNLDGECNYKLLKAQVAQQTLKLVDKSIKSYYKSIKDWSKNKSKYKGKPCLPMYKGKNSLFLLLSLAFHQTFLFQTIYNHYHIAEIFYRECKELKEK